MSLTRVQHCASVSDASNVLIELKGDVVYISLFSFLVLRLYVWFWNR